MTENTETKKEIKILAIESSCDETAAAVVVNGRDLRSNVISSQIALHTLYGGVVPEIASRKHIEKINQEGSSYSKTYQEYVLRQDKDGCWRILAFYKIAADSDTETE